jgi:hypothetical protein
LRVIDGGAAAAMPAASSPDAVRTPAQLVGDPYAINLERIPDEQLSVYRDACFAVIKDIAEGWHDLIKRLESEAGRRMRERNARKLNDPVYEVFVEDEYGAYVPDIDALKALRCRLPDEDAAKILKYVPPEDVPAHTIPEKWVVGNANAINAIIRNLGEDEDGNPTSVIGKALRAAFDRPHVGESVVFKRRKLSAAQRDSAMRNVTPGAL